MGTRGARCPSRPHLCSSSPPLSTARPLTPSRIMIPPRRLFPHRPARRPPAAPAGPGGPPQRARARPRPRLPHQPARQRRSPIGWFGGAGRCRPRRETSQWRQRRAGACDLRSTGDLRPTRPGMNLKFGSARAWPGLLAASRASGRRLAMCGAAPHGGMEIMEPLNYDRIRAEGRRAHRRPRGCSGVPVGASVAHLPASRPPHAGRATAGPRSPFDSVQALPVP